MTIEELKSHLSALPAQVREELANFLWDTLDDSDLHFDPEFVAELERRSAEIKSGQVVGIPAAAVYEELRKKYT